MIAGSQSDADLWQSFKNGDEDAFHSIYNMHYQPLYGYGVRLCGNPDLVKDAIHDLFVKIWNHKSNLGDVSKIRSYLLVGLRGNIFNALSRAKKIVHTEAGEQQEFHLEFSAERKHIQKETEMMQVMQISNALNHLSPRQKEIIYLRFFQELPYEEISDIMNISVKAAYKLNARALEALKRAFIAFLFTWISTSGLTRNALQYFKPLFSKLF